jgi:hypothetical protein
MKPPREGYILDVDVVTATQLTPGDQDRPFNNEQSRFFALESI